MSSAPRCEKFVRNAWKKELCSNCFKAKEEHQEKPAITSQVHAKLPDPPKDGILKTGKSKAKTNKVAFPSTEFEVIGYGGDDVYSDDDDLPDFSDRIIVDEPDTERDRALYKLTKSNTEFNTVPANLHGDAKNEPVRLGKQSVDARGQKKTLMVSVTPFGGGNPVCKDEPKAPVLSTNENLADNIAKEPEVTIAVNNDEELPIVPLPKTTEVAIRRSQPIDKNSKFRPQRESNEEIKTADAQKPEERIHVENKINEKMTTSTKVANLIDKAKKKVNQLPVIGDPNHYKLKSLDKKNAADTVKPIVLDMYDLREKVQVDEKKDETKRITNQVTITPTIIFETKKSEKEDVKHGIVDAQPPVTNGSCLYRSIKTVSVEPIEKVTKPCLDADDIATDQTPKNNCSNIENAQGVDNDGSLDGKLENFEKIIAGEEVTVFSVEKTMKLEEPTVTDSVELPNEEPPALPLSPPPAVDPRVSFLHQLTTSPKKLGEKPKVPTKPIVIPAKKSQFRVFAPRPKSPSIESFLNSPILCHHQPVLEALNDSAKKRQAPQPPSPRDEGSPVEERRPPLRAARSSDNLLKLSSRTDAHETVMQVPEPLPRRSLSLSQDSLLSSGVSELNEKKKSNRGRFSLRKLLHLGKHKEGSKEAGRREYRISGIIASPSQSPLTNNKMKPEIIHPLDLTGARLEVVSPHRLTKTRRSSSSASSSSGENRDSDAPSDSSASHSVSSSTNSGIVSNAITDRARKPPPPPRNVCPDQTDKPARPPPPKSSFSPKCDVQEITQTTKTRDAFYANIGEIRNGLAPNKPVRTGSLRETEKKKLTTAEANELDAKKQYWTGSLRGPPKCSAMIPPEDSGYESYDVSLTTTDSQTSSSQTSSLTPDENLYECVQVPNQMNASYDGSVLRGNRHPNFRPDRRSEGSVADNGHDYIKYRFLRSVSMPYCNSEAESEIYSPYSFCGSEMGEEDYEWSPTSGRFHKVSRLKMKKGRSIVHKNLEDNYGAVISANHEALSQVVEQMHQGPLVPAGLRPLNTAHNLRWSDFAIVKEAGGVIIGRRAFYPALWGLSPVTLCLALEQSVSSLHGKPPFSLNPLTELHDLVPVGFLPGSDPEDRTLVQCSISVLCRFQLESIGSYCQSINHSQLVDETKKEMYFILLQAINALKSLQAAGIEETSLHLTNVVVCRDERDPHPRVCILPGPVEDCASLCTCLLDILGLVPVTELSTLLAETLRAEKAGSLSQAKALLEFTLWGPADIAFGGGPRGAALQRWLDLERASVLHGLVRTRADLSVFEEWHLLFLVHTNAKVLADASTLLENHNISF